MHDERRSIPQSADSMLEVLSQACDLCNLNDAIGSILGNQSMIPSSKY